MRYLIFIFSFLPFMGLSQIQLVGNITTFGGGSYPTHLDSLGKGGLTVVANATDRNAITQLRRKVGMVVFQVDESKLYYLDAPITENNWVPIETGATTLDTTSTTIYCPSHGLDLTDYEGEFLPMFACRGAQADHLDSLQTYYAVSIPHVDSITIIASGLIYRPNHDLADFIGKIVYLTNTVGVYDTIQGTVLSAIAVVIDSNYIDLLPRSVLESENGLYVLPLPASFLNSYMGDAKVPQDTAVQRIARLYASVGLLRAGGKIITQSSAISDNPIYTGTGANPVNPGMSWTWTGGVNGRVIKDKELIVAIDLADDTYGGLNITPLDTVVLIGGVPTDTTVFNWLEDNLTSRNLRLPNGSLLYFGGTRQNPDYIWMVMDDISGNVSGSTRWSRLVKRIKEPVILPTEIFATTILTVCSDTCDYSSLQTAFQAASDLVTKDTSLTVVQIKVTKNGDGSKYSFSRGLYVANGNYANIEIVSTDTVLYTGTGTALYFDRCIAPRLSGIIIRGNNDGTGVRADYSTIRWANITLRDFNTGILLSRSRGNCTGVDIRDCNDTGMFLSVCDRTFLTGVIDNTPMGISALASSALIQTMTVSNADTIGIEASQGSNLYLKSVTAGTIRLGNTADAPSTIGISTSTITSAAQPYNVLTNQGIIFREESPYNFSSSSSAPAARVNGYYYNTTTNKPYWSNGSTWFEFSASSSGLDSLYYNTALLENGDTIPLQTAPNVALNPSINFGGATATQVQQALTIIDARLDTASAAIVTSYGITGVGTTATPLRADTSSANGLVTQSDLAAAVLGSGASGVTTFEGRSGIVASASGDYNMGEITNTPAGNIAATTGQAAINELDTEKLSTAAGAVTTTNILDATIATGDIANNAVTYAKMQDVAAKSLIGNSTAASADPQALTLGTNMRFNSTAVEAYEVNTNHEICFSLSPAFSTYGAGYLVDSKTGDATITYMYNLNGSPYPRGKGYYRWVGNTGSVSNTQLKDYLPTTVIGDTSKYVVTRVTYKRTGTASLQLWQTTLAGSHTQQNDNLATDNSGNLATIVVIRKIATTSIGIFNLLLNVSAGGTFEISDIQHCVIDNLQAVSQYAAGSGVSQTIVNKKLTTSINLVEGSGINILGSTIQANESFSHQEIPIGNSISQNDSSAYVVGQHISGSLTSCSTCRTVKWLNTTTQRGRHYWRYAAGAGNIANEQHRVRLPLEYVGDTTKQIIFKLNYILKDGGTQNNTTIQLWQVTSGGSNVTNSTNILSGQQAATRKTLIVQRKITQTDIGYFSAVVSLATTDTLEIYDLQWFVIDPDTKATVYEAPVAWVPAIETLDSTIATTYVLDDNGVVGVNGVNFTTFAGALDSIPVGSNGAFNKLYIRNGTYSKVSQGADYPPAFLYIKGESRDSVIIVGDGTQPAYSGVAQIDLDLLRINETIVIENVTLRGKRLKYAALHVDFGDELVCWVKHCRIQNDSLIGIGIGIGAVEDAFQVYEDNIFESYKNNTQAGFGIFWHNQPGQLLSATKLIVRNCYADGMGLITIADQGTTFQRDQILIENCKATGVETGVVVGSSYTGNQSSLDITYRDVDVNYVDLTDLKNDTFYLVPGYHQKIFNNTGSTLTAGTPVKIDHANSIGGQRRVVPATVGVVDGVILNDVATGAMGWMTIKGKTALVRNVDAAYVKGDFLKINSSGIFTKATSIDEASGVALETLTTTSDLLLANVFEKGNFVNLSLSGSANSLKIENSGGTDVVLKGGQGIGILEVVGTLDTAYIYTLEHWGEVSIAGGSTSVTAGTPERPDNDTPGTPTASLSSEFTQSGSTITYTGVAGQAELAGAISFTTDAIGDYLVSLYQEGVELPVTEVRVSCLIGSYVTIPVLTTSVNVATNDTFDLRIEPVTGSANITVHRYNVYARKIY